MSQSNRVAMLIGCCSALAACDSGRISDLTEPEAALSEASLAASNTWATRRSLSPWRMLMAAGTINGVIYVVGGRGRDGVTFGRVGAYHIGSNSWSQVAFLPSPRANPNGASVINGKLYVSGGFNKDGRATKTLFVYSPGSNSWTRKADMPRTSCGGDQGVIGGQLYVYTGCYASSNAGAVFFRYNPNTDTWVRRAAPPSDHSDGAGGVVNGKFYLASGFRPGCGATQCDDLHGDLDVYNPATNTWTTKRPIPQKASGMAAAMLNGKLFFAAGNSFGEPSDMLQVYDPATDSWMMRAPMPNKHSHGAAAAGSGRLFFIGGLEWLEPPGPSKVYAYTP